MHFSVRIEKVFESSVIFFTFKWNLKDRTEIERTFKLIVYSREDDLVKRSLSWIPITSSEVGIGHQFTSSDPESSGNDKLSGICSRLKTNGSDSDHMKMRAAMHDYDKSLPRVIPLKSFVNDQLKLQLYIEKLPRN